MEHSDNIKLLIAEDDPISRKFLIRLLKDIWSGKVLLAENGAEAWDIINREFASLLIIDWMMPHLTGIELCKRIRQANFDRYVYIILLTARDDQKDVLEGLEAGADDYIRKPFNPQELKLRIKCGLRIIYLENALAEKNEELITLNKKLEELARIDPLMKIGNRHSFHEAIEKLHNQFLRYGQGYGLILCDVDYFKKYNDTLGHQAGDHILTTVAQTIKHSIRESDSAFRYGGEEIVVLLPLQDLDGTITTAERLRSAVYNLNINHPHGIDNRVTISVGCTACGEGNLPQTWREAVEQADQALYQAKEQGRNNVCFYINGKILPENKFSTSYHSLNK